MTGWQSASSIRVVGRWSVLRLTGELDIESVPVVEELLVRLLTLEKPVVVIDLREVTFFDCALLGVLCRTRAGVLAAGGRFAVLCTRPWALKIMRLADLLEAFGPVASLADLADLDALDSSPGRGSRA
ncbi:STAS domain-containing protein [Streptomyces sp. NPDC020379]|uniref:STAS domain-containing protein n=1 Tax=Streptomyces sp. NPDC020379 TaxID=3365071 RepID=UPI0037BA1138